MNLINILEILVHFEKLSSAQNLEKKLGASFSPPCLYWIGIGIAKQSQHDRLETCSVKNMDFALIPPFLTYWFQVVACCSLS